MKRSTGNTTCTNLAATNASDQPQWIAWVVWGVIGVLSVVRLLLCASHEIVTRWADDYGFAEQSLTAFWEWRYTQFSHVRQPMYAMFLHAGAYLGVPSRLAIDTLWIVCVWCVVSCVRKIGVHWILATVVGGHLLLHPWSFSLFDRLIQDNLYTPLVMLCVVTCAVASLLDRPGLSRFGVLTCITAALAAHTRPESGVVVGMLLLAGLIAVCGLIKKRVNARIVRARVVNACVLPLVSVLVIGLAIKGVNHTRMGMWSTSDLSTPGMAALYNTLLAIPPETRNPRVPIMRDVRDAAYDASPTFAKLRRWLDGDKRSMEFAAACKAETGIENEYGSWTLWALRRAAWKFKPGWKSARELDVFYIQISDEIRDARAEAGLPMRSVPMGFIPPEWGELLQEVRPALARTFMQLRDIRYMRETVDPCQIEMKRVFDLATLRRTAVVDAVQNSRPQDRGMLTIQGIELSDRIKRGAAVVLGVFNFVWCAGLLAGCVVCVLSVLCAAYRSRVGVLFVIGVLVMLVRLGMTVMLDMCGVPSQPRYLFASVVILPIVGAAGLQLGVHALRVKTRRGNT